MTHPKTALVLSGGGSLGAIQVGMLQALARTEPVIDYIVGASVGALNGAFFAQNPTVQGADALAQLWCRLQRKDIFPLTMLAGLKALLFRQDHMVEAHGLLDVIRRALQAQKFDELQVPLHIVTTDVLSGQEVLLSSGPLDSALLASTAIPVVFPAVTVGEQLLIDGGVSSNTPIASAVALGAERIIVLPTGMSCALKEPPRNMAALALHVLSLLSMRQLDRDVVIYKNKARITIVPPLCPLAISALDFSQTASLIERICKQTERWIARGGLEQSGPLHVPLAHHDRR